jgi:hypothetical protein
MDPPKATFVPLAAMAKRPQPLPGTAAPWRAEVPRGGCRRLTDRVLAHVRTSGGPTGSVQPVFRRPRSSPPPCLCSSLTRSNRRGTDPYARWCGRGGTARCPPIPINPVNVDWASSITAFDAGVANANGSDPRCGAGHEGLRRGVHVRVMAPCQPVISRDDILPRELFRVDTNRRNRANASSRVIAIGLPLKVLLRCGAGAWRRVSDGQSSYGVRCGLSKIHLPKI